jgi:hypothetical protein
MTALTKAYLSSAVSGPFSAAAHTAHLLEDFRPRVLERAVVLLETRFSDLMPKAPPTSELEGLYQRVRAHWGKVAALPDLSRKEVRTLPWIAFYPSDSRPEQWLGIQPAFWTAFERLIAGGRPAAAVAGLMQVFLLHYPRQLPTFGEMVRLLGAVLASAESRRLRRWTERSRDFDLTSGNGYASFASRILNDDKPVLGLVSAAGLGGVLEASGFLRDVQYSLEEHLKVYLPTEHGTLQRLERVLELAERDGKLRFETRSRELAAALLLPFRDKEPKPEIQARIQDFLLKHLGDIRIQGHRWQGVDSQAKEVLLRWLVRGTLEDFFRVVEATALDRHWRERRAFWKQYIDQNFVSEAWIAFGPQAAAVAHARLGRHALSSGRLLQGHGSGYGGVQLNHSVLILKIADLVVVEWSHMGTCRIWRQSNRYCPHPYRSEYTRPNLVENADLEQRHIGHWRERIESWIHGEAGLRPVARWRR